VLTRVPEFERDITGLEMIGRVAESLFGGQSGARRRPGSS